jgi:Mn-dependent DtxR family transcriptional regulator
MNTLPLMKMTERSQQLMQQIWDARNNGADTEEKLVAAILKVTSETVKFYTAQNDLIVLDKNDILELAEELEEGV